VAFGPQWLGSGVATAGIAAAIAIPNPLGFQIGNNFGLLQEAHVAPTTIPTPFRGSVMSAVVSQ